MAERSVEPTVVLGVSQSFGLLREAVVDRLAVVAGDQPGIFPVNYLVDHGSIVFRTGEGTKLTNSTGRPVAFEVDGYDPASGEAWSVVVKGTAWEVTRLHEVLDALDLPLFPWHVAPKPHIVQIEPDTVTGRRFHVLDAPARHLPHQHPHRASHE